MAHPWTDKRVEIIIGRLLQIGVSTAAVVVLAGAAVYLAHNGLAPADYRLFRGEPNDLKNLAGIWHEATSLHGRGIIQFGLLLLIATPVARVAFSVVGFAQERDLLYVSITAVVLVLLLYSIFWSS
jgi:uncharacterized membrane protein